MLPVWKPIIDQENALHICKMSPVIQRETSQLSLCIESLKQNLSIWRVRAWILESALLEKNIS